MRGALFGLVASMALISARAGDAWAQKPRVVVEQFTGTSGDKLRQAVIKMLRSRGYDTVPDKAVAVAEANLGLMSVADNYAVAAKELKASAFLAGSMAGTTKVTAKLRLKDASGSPLGDEAWSGPTIARTLVSVDSNLGAKLDEHLGSLKGNTKPEPVARAKEPKPEAPPVASPTPEPEAPAPVAAKKRARTAEAENVDAEATVAASTDDADAGSTSNLLHGLDAMIGLRLYSRNHTYKDLDLTPSKQLRPTQAYSLPKNSLPGAPSIVGQADYFFHPYVGVSLGGAYSVGVYSKEESQIQGHPCNATACIYRTSSYDLQLGVKGRYTIATTELTANVGYDRHVFKVVPEEGDTSPPQVAGVDLQAIRAGVGARVVVTPTLAALGGVNYLQVFRFGEIGVDYFPNMKGRGGEGYAGVAFGLPWMKGLEARALADFRRYVFTLNPDPTTAERVAGGAVDQYIGITLAVGYRNL